MNRGPIRGFTKMIPSRLFAVCAVLALAGMALAQPLPQGMKVDMTLEEALGRMAIYQSGQSRLPISIVADHIVTLRNGGDKRAIRKFSSTLLGYLDASFATMEGKREIIRQLAKVGGGEAVPALEKAVADKDLWDVALLAMEDVPSGDADAALRRLLSSTDGRARLGVVQTLGLRHDRRAVPELAKILAADADPSARTTAARALARIGGGDARKALVSALEESNPVLHADFADAAMTLAQAMAKSGDRSGAYRIFESLYNPAESAPVRGAALMGMLSTAGNDAPGLWAQAIEGNPEARRVAVQAIPDIPGKKMTLTVVDELPRLPPALQAYVVRGLVARGDVEARGAVEALAATGGPEARPAALEALGALGAESSVPVLVKALASEDKATARAARAGLDRLPTDAVNPAIVAAMKAGPPAVRIELAASLAARNARPAAPDLLVMAKDDSDEDARVAALEALGDVGLSIDVPPMLKLLADAKSKAERDAAEEAIVKVARQSNDTSKRMAPVLAEWPNAKDAYRASLVRIMGRLQGTEAQEALVGALKDANDEVATSALRALSDWNDAGPRDTLLAVAKSDTTKSRQVLALRGFIRQSGMDARANPEAAVGRLAEAMNLAGRDDERRLVLSELGKIPDPAALRLVVKYADEGTLKDEALAAAMDIVQPIAGSHRADVMPVLDKYGPQLAREEERKAAETLLANLRKADGFVTIWLVAGPFTQQGKDAVAPVETPFAPESDSQVEWRRLRLPNVEERPGYVNLLRLGGAAPRVGYALTQLESPRAGEATLAVGSDDGVKIWLNGQVVHTHTAVRAAVADADKVAVRLKEGKNTLMLKVSDGGGDWGFYCRLLDSDGKPMMDVSAKAER